jgi:hypothetical protein
MDIENPCRARFSARNHRPNGLKVRSEETVVKGAKAACYGISMFLRKLEIWVLYFEDNWTRRTFLKSIHHRLPQS